MANIKKINDRVFYSNITNIDLNKKYDIGLVLGCKNYDIMYKRVDVSINLYNKKVINKIYVSGGVGLFSKNKDKSEAHVMKEYLLKKNIPAEDIVEEDKGKTTIGNMKNIIKKINSNKSIVIITSTFHSKRSVSILKRLTDNKIYYYGVLDGVCDIDNWYKNKTGRQFVKLEYYLLNKYIND